MTICLCGATVPPLTTAGRPPKYCSPACRSAAIKAREAARPPSPYRPEKARAHRAANRDEINAKARASHARRRDARAAGASPRLCSCGAPIVVPEVRSGRLPVYCGEACRSAGAKAHRAAKGPRIYKPRDPEKDRAYRLANRDKIKAQRAAWKEANPERFKAIRRKAKVKEWEATKEQAKVVIRMYELLPESAHEEYSEWLFMLCQNEWRLNGLLRHYGVEQYMGGYIAA